MLRFIMSFFGGIFSMLCLGLVMAALGLGGIFYMYGRDLPKRLDTSACVKFSFLIKVS